MKRGAWPHCLGIGVAIVAVTFTSVSAVSVPANNSSAPGPTFASGLSTGIYLTLACLHSSVTLNGTPVCDDQSAVQVGFGPSTGSAVWASLEATPDPGYVFSEWDGLTIGCFGTSITSGCPNYNASNPADLAASCPSGDRCTGSLVADYRPGIYLSVFCPNSGVTLNSTFACQNQDGSQIYFAPANGSTYWGSLQATPDSGYLFSEWTGLSGACFGTNVTRGCATSATSNPVDIAATCPSGQFCAIDVFVGTQQTGIYVNFYCPTGEITFNGTSECDDQSGIQVRVASANGGTFWTNAQAMPDSGHQFGQWFLGGMCLGKVPESGCVTWSGTNPQVISATCPSGNQCLDTVDLATDFVPHDVSGLNWAGFAVAPQAGTITEVLGSWIQPTITCGNNGPEPPDVVLWAGIDGLSSGMITPEQGGTAGWCIDGSPSYVAWYEYPSTGGLQNLSTSTYPVTPGDRYEAFITYDPSTIQFGITLYGIDSGWSFYSGPFVQLLAQDASAECIVERANVSGHLADLAKFSTAELGMDYTGEGSCYVGTSSSDGLQGIGDYPSIERINMVDGGDQTLAATSGLAWGSFTVKWDAYS